ncbi:MAG: thioesterase [Crocinitomix sp.]|nr:thioesterase [Crocinitomix sp.]
MKTKKTQLFLLHFAGGNCYSYQFLRENFSNEFDFIPLELPGRGKRLAEPLIKSRIEAIDDYFFQIKELRNEQPFVVYGHSMGASLGLEVVKELEKIAELPNAFIASGNAGPGTGDNKSRYLMNDEDLKTELRRLGGVPEEVLSNQELCDFFIPIIKADFEVIEKVDQISSQKKIKTPIYAMMGDEEDTVSKIGNWKNYAEEIFDYKIFSGNHFFIHEHKEELFDLIKTWG